MADTFKGIITADGKKRQLPYGAVLETPVSDKTLSKEGGFADAKVVGDKFAKVDNETASLKEDLSNLFSEPYIPVSDRTTVDIVNGNDVFSLYRKDRLWRSLELKNARTEAGTTTRRFLD